MWSKHFLKAMDGIGGHIPSFPTQILCSKLRKGILNIAYRAMQIRILNYNKNSEKNQRFNEPLSFIAYMIFSYYNY